MLPRVRAMRASCLGVTEASKVSMKVELALVGMTGSKIYFRPIEMGKGG